MIKLLKKYRGHQKGDIIKPLASELSWLEEFGYIDAEEPKETHTEAKATPKKANTRKPRKPKTGVRQWQKTN